MHKILIPKNGCLIHIGHSGFAVYDHWLIKQFIPHHCIDKEADGALVITMPVFPPHAFAVGCSRHDAMDAILAASAVVLPPSGKLDTFCQHGTLLAGGFRGTPTLFIAGVSKTLRNIINRGAGVDALLVFAMAIETHIKQIELSMMTAVPSEFKGGPYSVGHPAYQRLPVLSTQHGDHQVYVPVLDDFPQPSEEALKQLHAHAQLVGRVKSAQITPTNLGFALTSLVGQLGLGKLDEQ
jgi:hypothetical protein